MHRDFGPEGEHRGKRPARLRLAGANPAASATAAAVAAVALLASLSGCEPEVGSERWCEAMREKPRGDWTANEALDFALHCLFDTEE